MKTINYERFNETVYEKQLANGLRVFLIPKDNVSKTFAVFMTDYGSMHNRFIPIGEHDEMTFPDGIAHFLEHKLFEKEHVDIFSLFMQQSASPNAYTSFTKTAYLFSATQMIEKNIETLLDFVQEPYFSDASVEKEKGIIAQEINMYEDDPGWRAYMGAVKNMYHHLPINIDIAGTIPSIQQITKEDLYKCYRTFYHPANMALVVIGNFDEEKMMQLIETNQAKKTFDQLDGLEKRYPDEPGHVVKEEEIIHLSVATPKVTIGIKESVHHLDQEQRLKREIMQQMLLDYLFSRSGIYYEKLYEEQLIVDRFEYSTTMEETFNFSLISNQSDQPEKLVERIKQLLLQTTTLQIDKATFATMKKKQIGAWLREMNYLEQIANQYLHYYFLGIDYFNIVPLIEQLTVTEINDYVKSWIEKDRLTACMIKRGM